MFLLGSCSSYYVLIYVAGCIDHLQEEHPYPKSPANGHTGFPDQEMQFLEEGHKIRTGFLQNAERIQKYADEI